MPKYRVQAKKSKLFEICLNAKNEEEAFKKAGYWEEEEFEEIPDSGAWYIVGVEEVYNAHEGSHDDD